MALLTVAVPTAMTQEMASASEIARKILQSRSEAEFRRMSKIVVISFSLVIASNII